MKTLGKEWRHPQEGSIWGRKHQGLRVLSYRLLSVVPETPFMHFREEETKTTGHKKKIYKGIGKNRESSWGWVGERQFINIVEEMAGF